MGQNYVGSVKVHLFDKFGTVKATIYNSVINYLKNMELVAVIFRKEL